MNIEVGFSRASFGTNIMGSHSIGFLDNGSVLVYNKKKGGVRLVRECHFYFYSDMEVKCDFISFKNDFSQSAKYTIF